MAVYKRRISSSSEESSDWSEGEQLASKRARVAPYTFLNEMRDRQWYEEPEDDYSEGESCDLSDFECSDDGEESGCDGDNYHSEEVHQRDRDYCPSSSSCSSSSDSEESEDEGEGDAVELLAERIRLLPEARQQGCLDLITRYLDSVRDAVEEDSEEVRVEPESDTDSWITDGDSETDSETE